MTSKNYTCKLPVVGSEVLCILNSEWTNSHLKLLLIHDNQAWNGKFQIGKNEDVTELIDQLSLTEEKYVEETRNALTTHGGAEQFAYTLENDTFTWKKYVRTNMAVKFGYAFLSKVSVLEAFETVIDHILQSSLKLNEKCFSVNKGIKSLEEENRSLKIKLQDLIEKKNEMETTLYSQFLNVLNAKKKKIGELQKKICNTDENLSEPDLLQPNNDPFNSDTEIDSEEEREEENPQKKLDKIGKRSSLEMDDKNICTLPKRSRQTKNKEHNTSGPSRNTRNSISKCKSQDLPKNKSYSTEKKGSGRKSERQSCVLGPIANENDVNKSVDEAFRFPKRSKTNQAKPSTSKIIYQSDDETHLEEAVKLEPPDSDNTPSDIDVAEPPSILKAEESDEIDVKKDKDDNKPVTQTNKNDPPGKLSKMGSSCKGFSTSTLDILNQLV
uniref:DNA repair protein XRCC4 n=1 Tax=Graphocephala atropunctata TaxID=36148 RepID=A0A1B6MMR4_9HEMI